MSLMPAGEVDNLQGLPVVVMPEEVRCTRRSRKPSSTSCTPAAPASPDWQSTTSAAGKAPTTWSRAPTNGPCGTGRSFSATDNPRRTPAASWPTSPSTQAGPAPAAPKFGEPPERVEPDATGQVDERMRVLAALRRLPDRQREVLVLRVYADMTEAQTADALGCSVGTVKSSAHHGAARLRELLADQEGMTTR